MDSPAEEQPPKRDALAYRPDVDGLRAVAVLLVIVWHAGIRAVPGGLAGVDLFFVISGYVITGSLGRDAIAGGGISILRFYERRLRRIAPAFLVMLAAVLAAGFAIQFPAELRRTAGAALAALALCANMVLWRQGGYWGHGAETEPLRHVWSLSVEEQFYLVYPALLALLLARAPKAAVAVLASLAALSFGLFAVLTQRSDEAAFELGPARAWELLLGCLIALKGADWRLGRRLAEAVALVGAALIAAGALVRLGELKAIGLTSLGGGLIIWAGAQPTLVSRILAWRPIVFVGLISYSLYLWHWPLLAFANSLQPTGFGPLETAALLLATAVLGLASWRFVEQPLRRPWTGRRSRLRFFAICGPLAAASLAAGLVALVGQGLPARFPAPVTALAAYEDYRYSPAWKAQFRVPCFSDHRGATDYTPAPCFTAAADRPNVLLWGDSHAGEIAGPLADLTERLGAHFMQATMPSCPPMPTPRTAPGCGRFNATVLARLTRQHADVVVLSFIGRSPLDRLPGLLDGLVASGAQVIVVGPTPRYDVYVAQALARAWPASPDLGPWLRPASLRSDAQLKRLTAGRRGVRYVSAADLLCPAGRCRDFVGPGAPVIWDMGHLTPPAARLLVFQAIAPPLADTLRSARPRPAVGPAKAGAANAS